MSEEELSHSDDEEELQAALEQGLELELRGDVHAAMRLYRALQTDFADSIQPKFNLAMLLRETASTKKEIQEVESLLTQCANLGAEAESLEEVDASQLSLTTLAFLLIQCGGRDREVGDILTALGYKYRISDECVRYPIYSDKILSMDGTKATASIKGKDAAVVGGAKRNLKAVAEPINPREYSRGFDDVLSLPLLQALQTLFSPVGHFWKDHHYSPSAHHPSPYFSYVHPLADTPSLSTKDTVLDYVINAVRGIIIEQYPEVKEAKYAEWWAHCRPHCSGHQFHFDSDDEGNGGVRNPIVSTVVYLSDNDIGGPTLVTTQKFGENDISDKEGWYFHPKLNRLVVFKGNLLHGVIPGNGLPVDPSQRRITFMIAYWKDITQRPFDAAKPCAAQSFPFSGPRRKDSSYKWLHEDVEYSRLASLHYTPGDDRGKVVEASPTHCPQVWAPVTVAKLKTAGKNKRDAPPSYDECFQGW